MSAKNTFHIGRYRLVMVDRCDQYEVFDDEAWVGFIRVKRGRAEAYYPSFSGVCIYDTRIEGDYEFEAHERIRHLRAAVEAIDFHHVQARINNMRELDEDDE